MTTAQPTRPGEQRLVRALRRYAHVTTDATILDRVTLYAVLMTRFDMDELETLSFMLNLPNLPHDSQAEFARNLITHCEKTNRYDQLIQLARDQRPDAFRKGRATGS